MRAQRPQAYAQSCTFMLCLYYCYLLQKQPALCLCRPPLRTSGVKKHQQTVLIFVLRRVGYLLFATYYASMAEQEQAGVKDIAPESSEPRQQDAPVYKVCFIV